MSNWTIREQDLKPKNADVLSTIFCVGNGHICTRGTLSEEGLGRD
jgi:trehalose/maltose hydrolase-like predicted phosphorylase